MLASLVIRNFVLIEDAVMELAPGLNVLTGETGAGKTLLTRALGLLMGERAEEGLVGRSSGEATIQAVFDLTPDDMAVLPESAREMIDTVDSGELLVTRRLGKEGRNRCFINDRGVTLATMGAVVGGLLSFAGQHEYRKLLDPRYQLAVLDEWAGEAVLEVEREFRTVFALARDTERTLRREEKEAEARRREIDLLRFEVDELGAAGLSLDEEASLQAEQRLLARAEEVLRATGTAAALLRSERDGPDVETLLSQAAAQLAELEGVDPVLDETRGSLTEIQYQLAELARELFAYATRVSVDPARLETVNERLRLYTELGRKYGGSVEAAIETLREASERLGVLEGTAEDVSRMERECEVQRARTSELAGRLSGLRRQAAPRLEEVVAAQLRDLGMPHARVHVTIDSDLTWDTLKESGADSVEFLLEANPGQSPRSLSRTASGGELSRVLLAMKCALAGAGGDETLVFDEVDAGIGGRTAVAVAKKLRELADRSQLVVITHLAQVAALASRHYVIDKAVAGDETVTRLSEVGGDTAVAELCRMLGGLPDDAEVMAHARELRDKGAEGLLD